MAGVLLAVSGFEARAQASCTVDRATGTTIEKAPFIKNAYGARWNFVTNRVLFMQPNEQGYYQVFTISPDGTNRQAVTGFQPQLPANKHHGMPSWHPSGRYIVFEGQKTDWSGSALFGQKDYEALPGFGRHHDVWLATTDGSRVWPLTNEPNTKQEGVLIPVFSPDGQHIAWTSREPDGKTYLLKVGDFAETPQPHLENIRVYQPYGKAMYEPGSFTSDGRSLVYMGPPGKDDKIRGWTPQIYVLNLASGQSAPLTHGKFYHEHPIVVNTPSGDWVVYMSDEGVERRLFSFFIGTDWYAVRLDGSGKKRLSWMNARKGPESAGQAVWGCTVAPSPTGDVMLGDVQDSLTRQTGSIVVMHLTCKQ